MAIRWRARRSRRRTSIPVFCERCSAEAVWAGFSKVLEETRVDRHADDGRLRGLWV
jgi:hypothetical protein